MSRARYAGGEFDGTFKVEQGIRDALKKDGTATVTYDALEAVYEIEQHGQTLAGDLDEKCAFLCRKLGCECHKDPGRRECVFVTKKRR